MRQPLASIIYGDLTNGHESVGPAENYADLDVASPTPKSSWTNGTLFMDDGEQTHVGASQCHASDNESPESGDGHDLDEGNELQDVAVPMPTRWGRVRHETQVRSVSVSSYCLLTSPIDEDSSANMARRLAAVRRSSLLAVSSS